MKIGILMAGHVPDEMREKHGDYDAVFSRYLDGRGFEFDAYPVVDGVLPADVMAADGWLVTGSRHGAYEDLPWIPPLEKFLRDAYAASVPIVGICFGHQIVAQALGGKVEKFEGGWAVGPVDYESENGGASDSIIAWHQDQVTELPEEARVLAGNDFCRNAILAYGDRAFTIQPHPEFDAAYTRDLLEVRRALLPEAIAEAAEQRMDVALTTQSVADRIEAFFRRRSVG